MNLFIFNFELNRLFLQSQQSYVNVSETSSGPDRSVIAGYTNISFLFLLNETQRDQKNESSTDQVVHLLTVSARSVSV